MYPTLFNFFTFNFNMRFTRPLSDTLLRFVKINDINNYKIQNRTNYLLISFSQNNMINNSEYSFYNYINNNNYKYMSYNDYSIYKNNNKPIIIINNENDKKYTYLIKNKNNYKCKYELNYNQKKYKYIFDITSTEIDDKKTYWNIIAKVNEISNFKLIVIQLMNWINFIIDTNIKNYYLKKYIIMCYLLNLSL